MNVPFDRQVWSAEKCAEYLEISKTHFLQAVRYAEGFPPPLELGAYTIAGRQRHMDPRWSAALVAAWALGESTQQLRKSAANA